MAVQIQQWQQYLSLCPDYECLVLNIGESRTKESEDCIPVFGYVDFFKKLWRFAGQGYLLHFVTTGHSFKSWLSSFVSAVSGIRNGYKTVFVFGSGDAPRYIQTGNLLSRMLVKITLRLAGHIVCRNDNMRCALLGIGVQEAKISILPGFLGMVESATTHIPQAILEFLRTHQPVFGATVYVPPTGVLYPEYGIQLIVDAMKQLKESHPDIGAIIIGPGEEAKSQLKGIEEIDRHICFTGPLPHDIVMATMNRLAVFVRPTYTDGDSISVREALGLKIPVVASNTDFRPSGVLLFQKGQLQDFVSKLSIVLSGKHRVEGQSETDGSENAAKLLKIYELLNMPATERWQTKEALKESS